MKLVRWNCGVDMCIEEGVEMLRLFKYGYEQGFCILRADCVLIASSVRVQSVELSEAWETVPYA